MGEDTTVNMALIRRGYLTYRDPNIKFTHRSPCRTPWLLVRHHFMRGRGLGRILLRSNAERGRVLDLRFLRTYFLPRRLKRTSRGVSQERPQYRYRYALVFPLVVAGVVAAWLGLWYKILRTTL